MIKYQAVLSCSCLMPTVLLWQAPLRGGVIKICRTNNEINNTEKIKCGGRSKAAWWWPTACRVRMEVRVCPSESLICSPLPTWDEVVLQPGQVLPGPGALMGFHGLAQPAQDPISALCALLLGCSGGLSPALPPRGAPQPQGCSGEGGGMCTPTERAAFHSEL